MTTELPTPAQVRWQCRRGMLELDILLLSYFDKFYTSLSTPQQQIFIDFLNFSDSELYGWLIGREAPKEAHYQALVKTLREQSWKE